jgi:hypothetical protein
MKIINAVFLFSLLLIMSCSKDDSNPGNNSSTDLIKTFQFNSGALNNFSINNNYDTQKRLLNSTVTFDMNPSLNYTEEFEYSGNGITVKKYDALDNLVSTSSYFLNSSGLADSSVTQNGAVHSRMTYDIEGHLTRQINYDQFDQLYETKTNQYLNNNLISAVTVDVNGNITIRYDYLDYDLSHKNTVANANLGQSFLGKSSQNIPMKVNANLSGILYNFSYVLTFDSQGRIINQKTYDPGGFLSEQIYSYY